MKGEKTPAELAHRDDGHPSLINQWRARLLESAADVFGAEPAVDVTVLHAEIGELTVATDFWPVRSRVSISLDAAFCIEALDTVSVERLWRSVTYEEVYLDAYAAVPDARAGIGRYLGFYHAARPHFALGGRTPDRISFDQPLLAAA